MARDLRDFRANGRRFGFAHMRPLTLEGYTDSSPEVTAKVLVTFTSHCWSEAFDASVHTPDLAFLDERNRKRAFSLRRYEASLLVPGILRESWRRTVTRTERKNFVLSTRDPGGKEYGIFFALMPSKRDRCHVHCLVQSAYHPTGLPKGTGRRVRFDEAVDAAMRTGAGGTDRIEREWRFPKRRERPARETLEIDDYELMG